MISVPDLITQLRAQARWPALSWAVNQHHDGLAGELVGGRGDGDQVDDVGGGPGAGGKAKIARAPSPALRICAMAWA